MTRSTRLTLSRSVALALMASLAAAGCAGSSSPPTAGTVPPAASAASSVPSLAAVPSTSATAARTPTPGTQAQFALLPEMPTGELDAATASRLQGALDKAVASGAPDFIAAVITEDGVWAGAAGIDGPNGRKATANDEFAIASISKTFTAALVMRLAEQGKINLDRPLEQYLGGADVDTNGATVRQALMMTGGFPDHPQPATRLEIQADPSRKWTFDEILAAFEPPVQPAGVGHLDSGPSYELLALAAARVAGLSYGGALRQLVLDPVHADRILDQGDNVKTPKPWAVPVGAYLGAWDAADVGRGDAIINISSATRGIGGGSIASDAPSLAAWVWHLFAGKVVGEGSLRTMASTDGGGFAYGLDRAPYPEAGAVGNSGGKTGYGSQFTVFPTLRVVIVVFVNDENFIVEPTVNALLEIAKAS
jgi:D-alanyl-D-alanine carboxypeptidase